MVSEAPKTRRRTRLMFSKGLTEEQIIRIFSTAGKVLNFRLVYDRETGRPKGFGFVEFPDSGSSAYLLDFAHLDNTTDFFARMKIPQHLQFATSMTTKL